MIKKVCCEFCHLNCCVLATVDKGRVVKVRADTSDPVRKGAVCARIAIGPEVHYHPSRLNHPLKRTGARGEGKWQQISWDQALDEIAGKLSEVRAKYGPEAISGSKGTGRNRSWMFSRFFNLLGSPNYTSPGIICRCNTATINVLTYGADTNTRLASLSTSARCIVVWGSNPTETSPVLWEAMKKARKTGTKIIVVDPRRIEAARIGDLWLNLRPQTDGAMALGWLNVIIGEGLYDRDFVEKYTHGFDRLRERVAAYTPDRVSGITGVPAGQIIEAARMYAAARPAIIPWGLKPDQIGVNSTQACRSIAILRAITGNLDVEGGESVPALTGDIRKIIPDSELEGYERLSPQQRDKQLGGGKYKLLASSGYEAVVENLAKLDYSGTMVSANGFNCSPAYLWRAMLTGKPYPVKAHIVHANNPLLQATNTRLVYDALKSLDLLAVIDYFMTPTAMIADYVLPAADWLERPILSRFELSRNFVVAGVKAVEPEFERRNDYDFFRGLGIRLGEDWPWPALEDVFDYQLKGLGYTFREFVEKVRGVASAGDYRKYEKSGFATPTGKVELYSTIFEGLGYDPLPAYQEPRDTAVASPGLAASYPLILTTGFRTRYFYHTEHRQIKSMRDKHPDPLVQIHPATAKEHGIALGDWVWIETPLGKVKLRCELLRGTDPKVVHAQNGWWFPEQAGEEPNLFGLWQSNVNVLIDDDPEKCDPITGGWPHMCQCRISKVD
ncbi:MAG: molybdopterin-dependent oxidoreductase [Chloroflexi bacterium]|nr:molybdopterin-dependent oxidoreductase [Chloroflexota bacterium]